MALRAGVKPSERALNCEPQLLCPRLWSNDTDVRVTCANLHRQKRACFFIVDQLSERHKRDGKAMTGSMTVRLGSGKTHGFCLFDSSFTAFFKSPLWWALKAISRDNDIWSSTRCELLLAGQISRRAGSNFRASFKAATRSLYRANCREISREMYTWAVNWPSTWGAVRTLPWCRAGLSTGVGATNDGDKEGSFLSLGSGF